MRKNKLYIITFILTIILIFSTAFTLNLCGMPVEIETEKEEEAELAEEEKVAEEEVAEEEEEAAPSEEEVVEETEEEEALPAEEEVTEEAEEVMEEEEAATAEEVAEKEKEKTSPTIELKIYEGPTYSPADDVCFYRVEAIVTGNPTPTVSFSKDDSGGAWGSKKVQINLKRNSPTYTLTATATNSEGSDSDSITLSWGCGEEGFIEGEAEPEESVPPEPGNHPPVITEAYVEPSTVIVGETFTVYIKGNDPDGDEITLGFGPGELSDWWELLNVFEQPNEFILTAKGWKEGTYHLSARARDEHRAWSEFSYFTLEILPIPKVNEPIYIPPIITIPTLVNHPPEIIDAWAEPNTVSVGEIFTVYAAGNDPDGDTIVIGTSYSPDQFKLMGWPQWGEMSADFKALKLGNYKIEVYLLDGAEYSDRRIDVNITVEE